MIIMNDKKETLVPALRFGEFVGEWENNKLGTITDISKLAGFEYSKHVIYRDTGNIIALRAMNIKNNKLNLSNVKYIDDSDFSKLDRSKLYIGDLMFTYIGANIGDVALINENDRFYLAPNVARIRSDSKILSCFFLIQYFNIPKFINKEVYSYIASSSQPALSMQSIRKFIINLPTLPEQQKIANFLSSVDKKIEQLRQKVNLLKYYKKGVMQQIFSQKIRFKDDNGEAFSDWEVKKLGNFMQERTEYPKQKYPLYSLTIQNGIVPKTARYERSFLITENKNSYKIMHKHDFAFNPMNLRFGALARYKEPDKIIVSKYYNIFYCNDSVDVYYVESFLKSYNLIQFYNKMASGTLEEKKRVHYLDFINFKFLFPCLKEQEKIANYLSSIDEKIQQAQTQVAQAQQFKKGLLQQLFV
jgi:type I restriction enzyme S subunit